MTKKPKEQEQVDKIKVISPEIIVTMMGARPYYEIKYFDISDCKWHIGYSSYKLENVIEWKNECFEVIDTNDKWIPCSKQLPEESDYYMACIYNRDVDDFDFRKTWFAHVDDYDMEESEWRELYDFETVTAWKPLPEPYKGE